MVCPSCGAEVRFGVRSRDPGWWHRDEVDHTCPVPSIPPEVVEVVEIPQPEVRAIKMDPSLKRVFLATSDGGLADCTLPGGCRTVLNALGRQNWTLRSLKYARGPYKGASGSVLSISNMVLLKARGPVQLDGTSRFVVASWRDTKFDHGYTGVVERGVIRPTPANAKELSAWIKGSA